MNAISPDHYKKDGWEACDVRDQVARQCEGKISADAIGNIYDALKYLLRLGEKDDPIQEMQKAEWYLARAINLAIAARRSKE